MSDLSPSTIVFAVTLLFWILIATISIECDLDRIYARSRSDRPNTALDIDKK